MDAGRLIRSARLRSGLSLRQLAVRAGTSHATIAAYEQGRTTPNVDTLDRVLRAAGYAAVVELSARVGTDRAERVARGDELIEVLELAAMFPARHAAGMSCPRFGPVAPAADRAMSA